MLVGRTIFQTKNPSHCYVHFGIYGVRSNFKQTHICLWIYVCVDLAGDLNSDIISATSLVSHALWIPSSKAVPWPLLLGTTGIRREQQVRSSTCQFLETMDHVPSTNRTLRRDIHILVLHGNTIYQWIKWKMFHCCTWKAVLILIMKPAGWWETLFSYTEMTVLIDDHCTFTNIYISWNYTMNFQPRPEHLSRSYFVLVATTGRNPPVASPEVGWCRGRSSQQESSTGHGAQFFLAKLVYN